MTKIAKVFLLALGFGLLAVATALLTSRPAPAQASSTPVTVVNTGSNPVPTIAQGTTAVALRGTPTVNVAAGTVRVANSVAAPVQVQNVNDGITPYEDRVVFNINQGYEQAQATFVPLPAGKRLVIEHISVAGTVPSGQGFFASFTIGVNTSTGFGGGLIYLESHLQQTGQLPGGPVDILTTSQPIRTYTDTAPTLIANRSNLVGSAIVDATISGYLVSH